MNSKYHFQDFFHMKILTINLLKSYGINSTNKLKQFQHFSNLNLILRLYQMK